MYFSSSRRYCFLETNPYTYKSGTNPKFSEPLEIEPDRSSFLQTRHNNHDIAMTDPRSASSTVIASVVFALQATNVLRATFRKPEYESLRKAKPNFRSLYEGLVGDLMLIVDTMQSNAEVDFEPLKILFHRYSDVCDGYSKHMPTSADDPQYVLGAYKFIINVALADVTM